MNTTVLHPMIVHFPIALIITGFVFASIEMFFKRCDKNSCVLKTTYWLISLGALGAVASVVSGALFTTMHTSIFFADHRLMAFATAACSLLAAALYIYYIYRAHQNKVLHVAAYVVCLVAVVLVSITGHYGGLMVY